MLLPYGGAICAGRSKSTIPPWYHAASLRFSCTSTIVTQATRVPLFQHSLLIPARLVTVCALPQDTSRLFILVLLEPNTLLPSTGKLIISIQIYDVFYSVASSRMWLPAKQRASALI